MTRNYGALEALAPLLTFGTVVGVAVGIIILVFGIGIFVKVWSIMSQPIIAGSIPVWAIFGVLLLFLMFRRARRYV